MKEWIGTCMDCGKDINCENGFFNGVLLPGHTYRCFDCDEKQQQKQSHPNEPER